jgi:hypothetical protein
MKGGERMGKSYIQFVGDAKYLKKEDLSTPIDTELLWVKEEQVTAPNKPTKTKLVAYFDGQAKGLVLNKTNADTLLDITETDEYEKWKDIPVHLYVDPDVKYGSEKKGGIRLRKSAPVPF